MKERDCANCKHHTSDGCSSWDCEFEPNVGEKYEITDNRKVDHDKECIIGCIKHDGFIHTARFDKANQIILDALEAPSGDLISRADAIGRIKSRKEWCMKNGHSDFWKRLDYTEHFIKALPSADAVSGYTEWLEKIIVDAETIEWLCEDTNDKEWCDNNCHYSSIQAECLRHLYEVSKGGDTE